MRIALIGPMAVGKSTVGKALGVRLGIQFVDLDEWIQSSTGTTISEIFREQGETGFRQAELSALHDVTATMESCVLASGGGVITTAACRTVLMDQWLTIGLSAQIDTLLLHLQDDAQHRPLLESEGDWRERVRSLYEQRRTWYDSVSRAVFPVDGRQIHEIVEDICRWLAANGWIPAMR